MYLTYILINFKYMTVMFIYYLCVLKGEVIEYG
jgi:hypothetical protein